MRARPCPGRRLAFWIALAPIAVIVLGLLSGLATLASQAVGIELISGGVLLWRLQAETRGLHHDAVERVEGRAARASAVLLVLLCLYLVAMAALGPLTRTEPERSLAGIGISAAALIVMPVLGWRKRRIAERIGSGALRATPPKA